MSVSFSVCEQGQAPEALNSLGNTAFNAGEFEEATACYFAAIKADGKVAKFRTNLANALLRSGKPTLALEEAAAAIAVDASWPKGFYFKALALEQLGKLPEALAAVQEGLRIHKHNTALEELRSKLFKRVRAQGQQQQRQEQQQGQQQRRQTAGNTRTVEYNALVRDAFGRNQAFHFTHQIDAARLARALTDNAEANLIVREVTMPHHDHMLRAQPWQCVCCSEVHGRQRPATKLYLHAMSYLHQPQPHVQDLGPTPSCSSQECGMWATEMARQRLNAVLAACGHSGGF